MLIRPILPATTEKRSAEQGWRGQWIPAFAGMACRVGTGPADQRLRSLVPVSTLCDWEQARDLPPDFAMAYVRVIEQFPEVVMATAFYAAVSMAVYTQ
jgi:putative transcriptional regulator